MDPNQQARVPEGLWPEANSAPAPRKEEKQGALGLGCGGTTVNEVDEAVDLGELLAAVRRRRTVKVKSPEASSSCSISLSLAPKSCIQEVRYSLNRRKWSTRAIAIEAKGPSESRDIQPASIEIARLHCLFKIMQPRQSPAHSPQQKRVQPIKTSKAADG